MIAFTYIESNRRLDIDFHKSGKGGGSEEGQKAYLEDDFVEVFAKESLIPHNLCGERKSSLASVATRRIFETFGRRETPSCGGCSLRDAPSFRQKRPNLLLSSVWGGSLSRQLRRSHTREARFRWWKGRQGCEQVTASYYGTKHGGESCLGLFIIELNEDAN